MLATVSPRGDEKGIRCGDIVPNAVAAPATVSGESFVRSHWATQSREGDEVVTTREPGDLPSAVVTREDVGRGVQTFGFIGRLNSQKMRPRSL